MIQRIDGTCLAWLLDMGTARHRVMVDASRRFARAARRAERGGKYGRAALLYRAALMVLEGRSLDEVELSLETIYDTDRAPFASERLSRSGKVPRSQLRPGEPSSPGHSSPGR